MSEQFVLVVYDISNDRRRTKLHNLLLDFGSPVQYSVFECVLDDKRLELMRRSVKKITRPKKDNVRYYYLCAACTQKIESLSGEGLSQPVKAIVV